MKCPRCNLPLIRVQMDDVNLNQCGKCQGNLVVPDRLTRLAATASKSVSDLMDDWREYPPIDTSAKCRCPECRSVMEKHDVKGGVKFEHSVCRACDWIWLDPGEIELYQLAYLVSDKGKEAKRFKEIHENMTPEQKAELHKLIGKLPDKIAEPFSDPYRNPGHHLP